MPLARARSRGFALNWRLAVKGSQSASRSERVRVAVGALASGMACTQLGAGERRMINKVDKQGHRGDISAVIVQDLKHTHEHRCRRQTAQRAHHLWTLAARAGAAGGSHQWADIPHRAESCESFGELAQESAGRRTDVARGILHARSERGAAGVLRGK